jgi:hypothetical protein
MVFGISSMNVGQAGEVGAEAAGGTEEVFNLAELAAQSAAPAAPEPAPRVDAPAEEAPGLRI